MLSDFEIVNFRTFSHLHIERLAQVNLIVGKNNVGKTTLLEALRLHAMGGGLWEIRNILLDREEVDWAGKMDRLRAVTLFHRDRASGKYESHLRIGPSRAADTSLAMDAVMLHRQTDLGASAYQVVRSGAQLAGAEAGLHIIRGAATELVPLASLDRFRGGTSHIGPPLISAEPRMTEMAHWWDRISGKDAEARVLRCLNLVTPVEQIRLVENPMNRPQRMFIARLASARDPIPLKSLGDGIVRMFQIALAAQYAIEANDETGFPPFQNFPETSEQVWQADPKLLIDEIGIGIHYSILPDLWRFVFEMSHELGLQVFATSHSWDCIEAFQEVAQERSGISAALIRLESIDGDMRAVIADEHDLAVVVRDQIEVR